MDVKDHAFRVALLDACYSALPHEAQQEFVLEKDTIRKANSRARIIADEVMSIAESLSLHKPKVLMIGYVKAITDRMQQQGMHVIASDLDKNLIGKALGAQDLIHDGNCNRDLISKCDIVLMTGLTITSSTIDGIMEAARANSKPVVVFAQTGSNFAHAYLDFGITTAIAENFPWYSIPGRSTIRVYRRIAGGCP